MRRALALLFFVACNHHAGESERDRKGKATTDPPPPTTIVTPDVAMPADTTVYRVPIEASPMRGKATALVTIVEFSDFQCSFCQRAERTLTALRTQYGDNLRIVWKNEPMPNHSHARAAAEVALEALDEKGIDGFWAVHDALYALKSSALDDDAFLTIESANAINTVKAQQAIAKSKHQTRFDDDHKLAAKVGATNTPTFFINGRKLVGAQSIATFTTLIDAELAKASALVASGTASDKVYDAIMASAK